MENLGFLELNDQELAEVDGGGEWKLWEAAICFALLGVAGVAFYTIGTLQ